MSSDMELPKSRLNGAMLFLLLLAFLLGIIWNLIPSLAEILVPHFFRREEYGITSATLTIAAILATLTSIKLEKRFGVRGVLLYGLGSLAIELFFPSLPNFFHERYLPYILATQLFLGFGIGFIVTAISVFMAHLALIRLGAAIMVSYGVISLGSSSIPLLTKIHMYSNFWEYFPLIMIILVIFFFAIAWLLFPDIEGKDHHPTRLHLSRKFWIFAIAAVVYAILETRLGVWSPLHFYKSGAISRGQASYGLSVFWATFGFAQLFFALLSFWISEKTIYRICPLIMLLAFLKVAFWNPTTMDFWVYIIGGLGASAFFPLSMNFALRAFPHSMTKAAGSLLACYFLGTGISSLLIAVLSPWIFLLSLLCILLTIVLVGIAFSIVKSR